MGRPQKGDRVSGITPHRRKWRFFVTVAGGARVAHAYATKGEAQQALEAVRLAIGSDTLTGVALDQYETFLQQSGHRYANRQQTVDRVKQNLTNWLDRTKPLIHYTTERLISLYDIRELRTAAATHHKEIEELKRFFDWCVTRGMLPENPAATIRKRGRPQKRKKQLSRADVRAFLATAYAKASKGDEHGIAALMALTLGMRSEEIRSLRFSDIDRDPLGVLIHVRHGKTAAAARAIEVPTELASLLPAGEAGYVFPAPSKTGYRSRTWLQKAVKAICEAAGVDPVCPHSLRGSFATFATRSGVASDALAGMLGHTNIRTTSRHYASPGSEISPISRQLAGLLDPVGSEMGSDWDQEPKEKKSDPVST